MRNVVIVVLAVIILISGYFIFQSKDKTQTNTNTVALKKVTIAEFGEVFLYAPLYVAKEKGFFDQQGLDVSIVPAGGDEKVFAALLSGDAQLGVGDPTFTAISAEKGQPGKVVASVLNGVPFWGVAKKASISKITTPSQLGTYSVATFPSPSTAYTLQKKMFQSGNLKPNIKETAFGSLLAALEADQVDIALELEPNVSTAVNNGNHIVYSLSDYYPDFAITGLTALPSYVDANPTVVQSAVNAMQKAMDYIRSNPNDVATLLVARFPEVSSEVAKKAVGNMIEANVFPKDTIVTKAGWDAAIQARTEVGDLKKAAEYSEFVNSTFSALAAK